MQPNTFGGLTALDWAAIIGAAAWIPQIAGAIARKLAVPKLRLVPSNAPEIGFTSLGPIFNLTCAISAERKDAIIERMTATVEHANGQKIEFTWTRLNELLSEIRGPESTAEVSKSQQAIALKVGTLVLAEKSIGFHDLAFQEQVRLTTAPAAERLAFLRESSSEAESTFLTTKEFADLVSLWERQFPWREGKYVACVRIHIVDVVAPTEVVLQFELSAHEVKRLRSNCEEIAQYQRDLVSGESSKRLYNWDWVYPPFAGKVPRAVTH